MRVMALRVPSGLRGRDICVELGPRSVKVSHATTGEVWLEGELHRGINRVQSTWDYGGGEGPDGLVLFLEKTNAGALHARPCTCGVRAALHQVAPRCIWRAPRAVST